jgi:hypothetical protein
MTPLYDFASWCIDLNTMVTRVVGTQWGSRLARQCALAECLLSRQVGTCGNTGVRNAFWTVRPCSGAVVAASSRNSPPLNLETLLVIIVVAAKLKQLVKLLFTPARAIKRPRFDDH